MDIREDGLFKAESISKTMTGYDLGHQKLSERITDRMLTNLRLSAFLIRERMTNGSYPGRMDIYDGMFVRIRDGRVEPLAGADDRFKNLQPEDIMTEYTPKTVTTPDGEELLAAGAHIDDELYYVTWLEPEERQQYFFYYQDNMDQLLTYVGSAYGGEFFIISNDDPEGTFTARTEGFAEFSSIADLGIQPKDLGKQYFPLKTKTDRYMCYVLPLENREQTTVYCDIINDEVQTGIHRAFTKILFAGSFLTAMLVLCFSVLQAAAGHTLSESEAVKYTPEKMQQKILIFSLLTGLALMFITVFTTFVQESHHENHKGMTILDSLEMQLSESERLASDAERMEIDSYTYLMAKISAEATGYPQFLSGKMLNTIADIISADLIMAFDENGNEIACSQDYTGFSLGDAGTDQIPSDFLGLLRGKKYIRHDPEPDFVTGEEHYVLGVRCKNAETNTFGALLFFISPSVFKDQGITSGIERIYSNLATGEELIMEVDSETYEILSSSGQKPVKSKFLDLDAAEKSQEENKLDIFALGDILYYGISRTARGSIWYYAEAISGMVVSALIYAVITGLFFMILCRLTCGYAMRGYTPEYFEECLSANVDGASCPVSGTGTASGPESGSGYKTELTRRWRAFSPDRKALTVFWVLCGLVMLILLGAGFLSGNATLAFYISGNWQRGINLFAITAIAVFICIGRLQLIVMDVIFIIFTCEMSPREKTVSQLIFSMLRFVIIVGLIYNFLSYLGVNTRALLASVGIFSLALSLGAKDLVAEILAGLSIVTEGEFETGEIVEIDGFLGMVDKIGIRSTWGRNPGSQNIRIFKNNQIQSVINYSRETSRFHLYFEIPVFVPIDMVTEFLERELPAISAEIPGIISGPSFSCISKLDHKTMTIRISGECLEKDVWSITKSLNMNIKKRFDQLIGLDRWNIEL